ncbi:DUF3429 domain-containing protein [Mesobacterium pallidum]|uniref:DUF3429 domain-containing protein n=1 Tax=Mesobacterium pallidum TaxID=2872037 RepID=UPI001EE36023|nr:DUF3429 domain-containing protein [Mesobacterium pallidum]
MRQVPPSALWLGVAGLIPFLWGAALAVLEPSTEGTGLLAYVLDGPRLLAWYGTVILAFMSGVLWGFATRAEPQERRWAYGLSVLPALWAAFNFGPVETQLTRLTIGFVALLGLDWFYVRRGLGPDWWLRLRITLTVVVVACLAVGIAT